jgi:hypothetical protein
MRCGLWGLLLVCVSVHATTSKLRVSGPQSVRVADSRGQADLSVYLARISESFVDALYLGKWKTTPQSRFCWNVRARSMELIGVLFCSPCNVMKLRVPSVYQ